MKRYLLVMAIVLLAALSVQAQIMTAKFDGAKMQKIIDIRFTPSLKSDYQGIVEGAIYNLIVCKRLYPSLDYSDAAGAMQDVTTENSLAHLRYKAYLGYSYLSNAEGIDITPVSTEESFDYLFKQISEELQSKLLVSNISVAR